MLPFNLKLQSGVPIHDQVVYAVKRAILSGALSPGERFPSIRKLGKALGINPNTAQRIVATLTTEGFLEIRPGIGSVVCQGGSADPEARNRLLGPDLEEIVVKAKELGLELPEVLDATTLHWRRLDGGSSTDSGHDKDPDGSEGKDSP